MVSRCILVISLFFCTGLQAFGQEWFNGSVVLKNKKVLSGEIAYLPGRDAVFLKVGDVKMVLPAFRVESFSQYDEEAKIQRNFVVILNNVGAARTFQFYEVVTAGVVSVLRQQNSGWYSIHRETMEYEYFVMKDETIMPMKRFRRHVYPSLKQSSATLSDYVAKNKIDLFNFNDTMRLIEYFNTEQSRLASTR